jgi:hypothetical protein
VLHTAPKLRTVLFSLRGGDCPETASGLGSLTLADITAIEAAKVQLAARVEAKRVKYIAKRIEGDSEELNTDDEEEHEEVQTLGRMSTQLQLRSQVNRYFTAMEAMEEVDVMEEDNEDDGEPHFDTSDEDDDFDQEIDGDQDVADENM